MNAAPRNGLDDPFATKVNAFLAVGAGSVRAIDNVVTGIEAVGSGTRRLPVTINHSEHGNAWICSPHTTYALYAKEELSRFGLPVLGSPLQGLCTALGHYLKNNGITAPSP